jgi:signal transduction histidine kinase
MLLRRTGAASTVGDLDLERVTRQLQTIDQQTNRLARMIDELLDVSRIQTGQLELDRSLLNIDEMLDQVIGNLKLVVETHTLQLEPPQERLWVAGDSGRLEQVLVNLVTNAVRYSEPGTTVTVSARRSRDPRGSPVALIQVRDEGVGIAANDLSRIFDRFYRSENAASPRHAGLGLGLYISSQIVRLHSGRLWAESEPAKGSLFTLELPIAERSE